MIKIFKTTDIKNNGITDKSVKDSKNKNDNLKTGNFLNPNNDIVDISGLSEIFSTAKKEMENIPDIREDKINLLKQKIENGEYNIDETKVADKIIENHIIDELV